MRAPMLLLACGLMLAAAAADPGLPGDYWRQPAASGIRHATALENDLHPEACAQCHAEQHEAWRGSRHALAFSPGLAGQLPGMAMDDANGCLSCHAPLNEQRLTDAASLASALCELRRAGQGHLQAHRRFPAADIAQAQSAAPLALTGVSCASCHVRGGRRFGPPPRDGAQQGATGRIEGPAHGGFTATRAFEQSAFCARCHQFPPSAAINGKPLENTLAEWRQSRFAREGVSCQQCHMPERRHLFRGIHDPDTTRGGLDIRLVRSGRGAGRGVALEIVSRRIGHAFPTYVTPQVTVRAEALAGDGRILRDWRWRIGREVRYANGWRERQDTRLMPGEARRYRAAPLPAGTQRMRFRIEVEPDHFYKGVYRELLAGELAEGARKLIGQALRDAQRNDYLLFTQTLAL